jgi:hypothetical protein
MGNLLHRHLRTPNSHTRFSPLLPWFAPLLREKVFLQELQRMGGEVLSYLCPGLVFLNHLSQETLILLC